MIPFVFFVHWVADFCCQSRWMAENKSKSVFALTVHVGTYGAVLLTSLLLLTLVNVPILNICLFAMLNTVLHWFVDLTTSKITTYFYEKKDMHKFFATIGLDQYIHSMCLWATTYVFL